MTIYLSDENIIKITYQCVHNVQGMKFPREKHHTIRLVVAMSARFSVSVAHMRGCMPCRLRPPPEIADWHHFSHPSKAESTRKIERGAHFNVFYSLLSPNIFFALYCFLLILHFILSLGFIFKHKMLLSSTKTPLVFDLV